jgi:hypothetical protein
MVIMVVLNGAFGHLVKSVKSPKIPENPLKSLKIPQNPGVILPRISMRVGLLNFDEGRPLVLPGEGSIADAFRVERIQLLLLRYPVTIDSVVSTFAQGLAPRSARTFKF